jgi:HK97 family phage prohead protease
MTPELEVRSFESYSYDGAMLEGYAAVFDVVSRNLGGFVESLAPSAFDRALRDGADVRALINHEPARILGRTTARTLKLSKDGKGLRVSIKLPRTSYAADLAEMVKRGDVTGMSFSFRPLDARWEGKRNGLDHQRIYDVELRDVSAVTFPVYEQTSLTLRSLAEHNAKRATDAELGMLRLRLKLLENAIRL